MYQKGWLLRCRYLPISDWTLSAEIGTHQKIDISYLWKNTNIFRIKNRIIRVGSYCWRMTLGKNGTIYCVQCGLKYGNIVKKIIIPVGHIKIKHLIMFVCVLEEFLMMGHLAKWYFIICMDVGGYADLFYTPLMVFPNCKDLN